MAVKYVLGKYFFEKFSNNSASRLFSWGNTDKNLICERDSLIGRRLTQKMTNTLKQKKKISSKRTCNPFEREELIQRIGGRRIRNQQYSALLSTLQSNKNNTDQIQELTEKDMKNEKWLPVYRFRGIHAYAIITRLKFFQTLCSIFALPYCYYQFLNDEVSAAVFYVISVAALAAPIILIAFTRYFNRIIGVIAINKSRNVVRIGHLSYWGGRMNYYIPIKSIIPLTESSENPLHNLLKLKCFSNDKIYFLLSTSKVEIVDMETSKQIFGTNEYFLLKNAVILDEKYNVKSEENV